MNEVLCIVGLSVVRDTKLHGALQILSMRTREWSAQMARTWSHDPPIGFLQPLENVTCTDLPFSLKIWVIDSMCVNDLQRLRNSLYGALIVNMKANLLEGKSAEITASTSACTYTLAHCRIQVLS